MSSCSGDRQLGVSLVELLVAMLLGVILIAGVGHLFMSANRTYMLQDELSRIQENGRFALDLISRDVRMAGFAGCPSATDLANAVSTTSSQREWMTHFDKGILGIPLADKSRIDSNAISEAIVVHRLNMEESYPVSGHSTGTAKLTLSGGHGISEGDLVGAVRSDCQQVSVFKAGSDTTTTVVSHESASSGSLFNATTFLGGNYNAIDSTTGASNLSHAGAELIPLSSVAYYLRVSNGIPNLYRKFAGETASGNALSAEAALEGIEGLRFMYGHDSDQDGIANQYRTAAGIGLFSNDWRNVVSVRMEILVRSIREVTDTPQAYFYAGNRVTPTDRFLRRVFVMTMELRNRSRQ